MHPLPIDSTEFCEGAFNSNLQNVIVLSAWLCNLIPPQQFWDLSVNISGFQLLHFTDT